MLLNIPTPLFFEWNFFIFDIIRQFYGTFCIYKNKPKGSPLLDFFLKKIIFPNVTYGAWFRFRFLNTITLNMLYKHVCNKDDHFYFFLNIVKLNN